MYGDSSRYDQDTTHNYCPIYIYIYMCVCVATQYYICADNDTKLSSVVDISTHYGENHHVNSMVSIRHQ
jgi:hypothetical protein